MFAMHPQANAYRGASRVYMPRLHALKGEKDVVCRRTTYSCKFSMSHMQQSEVSEETTLMASLSGKRCFGFSLV